MRIRIGLEIFRETFLIQYDVVATGRASSARLHCRRINHACVCGTGRNPKCLVCDGWIYEMALRQGEFRSYDFDRMVVLFTMMNDQTSISCAISTDAMDHLEGSSKTPPAQREHQFMRLREQIEQRAIRKFEDVELEGTPPGVILRKIDFRK
jgi:hypothetical protein